MVQAQCIGRADGIVVSRKASMRVVTVVAQGTLWERRIVLYRARALPVASRCRSGLQLKVRQHKSQSEGRLANAAMIGRATITAQNRYEAFWRREGRGGEWAKVVLWGLRRAQSWQQKVAERLNPTGQTDAIRVGLVSQASS